MRRGCRKGSCYQLIYDIIAVCNNVGEAAFLGPNQKIENLLPRAS
jgi:hypothetical protein